MSDLYLYVIVALLPLSACMLVFQVNPYYALVVRGILGAVAALVYAVLGAADVALTEALVGTMLSITLYAVAVRSSLVMRLGVLQSASEGTPHAEVAPLPQAVMDPLRALLSKRHMRLEIVPYADPQALNQALAEKAVHAIFAEDSQEPVSAAPQAWPAYRILTRIRRLSDLMQAELPSGTAQIALVNPAERSVTDPRTAHLEEARP